MTTTSPKTENLSRARPGGKLFSQARNRFWLAPMAGITDVAFRRLMDEMGAGILISELVSTKGLKYNSGKTQEMIRVHQGKGTLVGIQLFGEDEEDYIEAADLIAEAGADFLDINLGCPVKKVVKKGCGAALMRDPLYLEKFLTEIRKGIPLPLTVKMRTGWSRGELTLHECISAAEQAGCEWVAVHGRTREQGYSGKADWDLIAEARRRTSIPIIGNGDIRSSGKARQLLEETGVDAVMIGRGALRNPWIFRECTDTEIPGTISGPRSLLKRYEIFLREAYDHRMTLLMLRKCAVWLAFGYPGAAAFRGRMFQLHTVQDALDWADEFFNRVEGLPRPRFDDAEAFMMGGHG